MAQEWLESHIGTYWKLGYFLELWFIIAFVPCIFSLILQIRICFIQMRIQLWFLFQVFWQRRTNWGLSMNQWLLLCLDWLKELINNGVAIQVSLWEQACLRCFIENQHLKRKCMILRLDGRRRQCRVEVSRARCEVKMLRPKNLFCPTLKKYQNG